MARALSAAKASASSTGLVKNEPAETVSGSSGSRTMPLPRRSARTAARTSASGGPRADLDAQGAGELGIADRRRALRCLQGEAHREHQPASGLALERARAVGEGAVGRGERAHGAVGAVEHAHGADRLGHLLAIGADVLDRRRADRARDPGQALDAGQAAGHAVGHERVPRLAGGDLQRGARRARCRGWRSAPRSPGSPRRPRRRSSRPPARAAARRPDRPR